MRGWTLVLVLILLGNAGAAQKQTTSKALNDIFASEWDYDMQQSPEGASAVGDRRWNDRWSDDSLEAIARRHQHEQELLARLAKIDRAGFSPADQLNYDLFKKGAEEAIEGYKFHSFL